jgi:hypothetical protein
MKSSFSPITDLAMALLDSFPRETVSLEKTHHVVWVLITIRKKRVAVRWNSERPSPGYEICTPEGYSGCGYMQTTAHASNLKEAIAGVELYRLKGFKGLFQWELDSRVAEAEAHPERCSSMAQMKRRLKSRIRKAGPYLDLTPPSLAKVVAMPAAELRRLKRSISKS